MTGAPTGAVQLRDVVDADIAIFFEQQRDPAYNHMAAFTSKDPSNREAFLAHWKRIRADATVVIRTILFDGEVAGSVASWVQGGERQITYGVARQHWGKGIATRALEEFLRVVAERPLFAAAARDNVASLRVLEKCGFSLLGYEKGFANARGQEIEEAILKLA